MWKEFLNSPAEVHAFVIGIYEGFKDVKFDGIDEGAKRNPDVKKEPHYAKGGYVLGAFLRILAIILLVYYSATSFI